MAEPYLSGRVFQFGANAIGSSKQRNLYNFSCCRLWVTSKKSPFLPSLLRPGKHLAQREEYAQIYSEFDAVQEGMYFVGSLNVSYGCYKRFEKVNISPALARPHKNGFLALCSTGTL